MIPLHFSLALVIVLSVAVFGTGCRRKKAETDVAPPMPSKAPAAIAMAPALPPIGDTTPVQKISTPESLDSDYTAEMADSLNSFLGDYIRANKRIPKDLNEMVSLKIITSIPPVPGGKQWVIDQRTGRISAR